MKKFDLINALAHNEGNPDVEILMQTKINGDYFNISTKDIISVDNIDDDRTITIRCKEGY